MKILNKLNEKYLAACIALTGLVAGNASAATVNTSISDKTKGLSEWFFSASNVSFFGNILLGLGLLAMTIGAIQYFTSKGGWQDAKPFVVGGGLVSILGAGFAPFLTTVLGVSTGS